MKFKNSLILIYVLFYLLKISRGQLFEQFNDEPSHLEKSSKSIFDTQEDDIKPNTPAANKNVNKQNNKETSIFSAVDEGLKPFEIPKSISKKEEVVPSKTVATSHKSSIKNLANSKNNPVRSLINNNKINQEKNYQSKQQTPIIANKVHPKPQDKKTQEEKDEVKIREEKLKVLKNKNSEKLKLQKEELKRLQNKFDEVNNKTKNILKVIKSNSSLEKIKEKYRDNIELVQGYTNDYKYMNKNIKKLENNIENISNELKVIENKKDLNDVSEVKKIDISHKLQVEGNLNTKKLLAEELKFGENKISNNFIQLDRDFKVIYKNKVKLVFIIV